METVDKVMVPVSSEEVSEVENTVNQHVEKSSDGLYKCGLCGKTAKHIRNLKNHIETHLEGLSSLLSLPALWENIQVKKCI